MLRTVGSIAWGNMNTVLNTVRNAVRPGYAPVMISKVMNRLGPDQSAAGTTWAAERVVPVERLCAHHDQGLWEETLAWHDAFMARARAVLAETGVQMGGGGETRLLYFLVRLRKPTHVVETGVASGFSTEAILAAMAANDHGTLHSSDFPYFRLSSPEEHIGAVVQDDHKDRWRLHLKGDRRNLPTILKEVGPVGLFHYDSDKSRRGREFGLSAISPVLEDGAIVVMDDIHNDLFFHDLTIATGQPWSVTGSAACPVGVLGWGSPTG